ncbi:MAG: ABC transporter permease [Gemmobacter sp.]|jgi:peptide/nickel transport system permease protein|nr:ABC transporter permease [Gemmobacter sp.]
MFDLRQLTPSGAIGLLGLTVFLVITAFAPLLAPYNPYDIVGGPWEPHSDAFLLGTDNIGRDLLSRLLHGIRTTVTVSLAANLLAFAIGITLGFIAAALSGWGDQLLSRANELIMSIPTLIWALALLSMLPPSIEILIAVIAVLESTRIFRISRAVAVNIVASDFVEASRLRGEGLGWLLFREILPNAWSPLMAEFGLRFSFVVLFISALSYLGLGIQPPAADLGGMIKDNKDGIAFGIGAAMVPGATIILLAVSANLFVDWLSQRRRDPRRTL